LSPDEERKKLHVPEGFEVELVASEPAIRKPMNIAFDDRGRLWITESVEYPFPAKEGTEPRDCVRILEDTDGDGLAEKVTTFACGLNIPIGILPISGGAIVYGIPRIWLLLDRDGDDRADEKKDLYGTFGHGDTHGMVNGFTWGFDGWIYSCHGFSNTSEVRGVDGSSIQMQSGNTFRFRPDGSRVEQFTHGQVNPFGLCLDSLGDIYSTDCHSEEIYMLLRGAWYPSFGKPADALGFAPVMIDHDHASTGIAGIAYYTADQFPPEYKDAVFTGNVITNRVDQDRLEARGSTRWAVHRPELVRSEDPWFRPVDLKIAPDGSLYIADFYNKVIGHYEVPLTHPARDRERGRIWRVVYRGAAGDARPTSRPQSSFVALGRAPGRAAKEIIPELIDDLASASLPVRVHATNALVAKAGSAAVDALRKAVDKPGGATQKAHGLWALERLAALEQPVLEDALRDPSALVRVHAHRILEARRDLDARERSLVQEALKDDDPFVRRAAARSLGAHPDPSNLLPLLALLAKTPAEDTHLVHTVRMAARDQLLVHDTWGAVDRLDGATREAELLPVVARAAPCVEAAMFLLRRLEEREGKCDPADVRHIARHAPADSRDSRLKDAVHREAKQGLDRRRAILEMLVQGLEERGDGMPAWVHDEAVDLTGELLSGKDDGKASAGVRLVLGLKLVEWKDRVSSIALEKGRSDELRRSACEATIGVDPGNKVSFLARILGDAGEPGRLREHAAGALGDVRDPAAVEALVVCLRAAPERLATRIASALAKHRAGGERLLDEIQNGKASPRLLLDREVQVRLAQAKIDGLEDRIKKLTEGLPDLEERIRRLMAERLGGFARASPDAGRGAAVFEKTCSPCHKVAGKGNKVGPELDGIANRGLERLLEDTLDPSRNVDQAFRVTVVTLTDGQVRTGLLLAEEGAVLLLADAQGKTFQVPKDEVAARESSGLSLMPSDIAEKLPEGEFYDLMAFLLARSSREL
jgi:putative heme-binding domain-containing protein